MNQSEKTPTSKLRILDAPREESRVILACKGRDVLEEQHGHGSGRYCEHREALPE